MIYYDSVAPDDRSTGMLKKTGSRKNRKKFDFKLEKTKIGDILRIRCVLSATRMLDKLLKAVRNKKLKNFEKRACKK